MSDITKWFQRKGFNSSKLSPSLSSEIMYKGSPGMVMHMMRRDYENFAGGARLKSALMGASKTLLEEALSARAPGIDKVSSEPGSSSEEDEDEEAATPPARKRPAAAPPTVSKKRRPAPSKPTGVPKHIRYRWVPIRLLKGVGGEENIIGSLNIPPLLPPLLLSILTQARQLPRRRCRQRGED